MDMELELDGNTIEIRGGGTGSTDPWTLDYAHYVGVSLMCTADMADFLLINGNHIYRARSFNSLHELNEMITQGVIDSWDMFIKEWLMPMLEKKHLVEFGTLDDSIKNIDELKRRGDVWKSIPEKEKRKTYEYLKSLSKEEINNWYRNKYRELWYERNNR